MHNILPRVMAKLSGDDWSDNQRPNAELDRFLREAQMGMGDSQMGEDFNLADNVAGDDKDWESLLLDAVTGEQRLSPAEINRKRKRLTFIAFQDPNLVAKALAVESLVQPNVHHMHQLFQRSAVISKLQMLPPGLPSSPTLAQQEIPLLKEKPLGLDLELGCLQFFFCGLVPSLGA